VTVTATPEPGYTFIGWTGTGVPTPDTTNPVTVRMNGDKTLTANFERMELERDPSSTLQNSDMRLMNSALPVGQTPYITGTQFNGNAVAGGTSSIVVTSSEQLRELYLQVKGENGYYVRQLSETDLISSQNGKYIYFITLQFSQLLGDGQLQFTVSGVTAQQEVSSGTENRVQIIKAGTGALQVSLSWDKNDDVDLHIFTPSGAEIYYGRKRVAATTRAGKIELDIDSNAGCSIDGKNTENIYFESPLEDGEYAVQVCLYSKCITGAGARYNVSVNSNGTFVEFSPNQSGQFADNRNSGCVDIGTISIRNGYYAGY
jgi:uncharacterized repeat protein (TIGR02543 family)